MQYRLLGPLEVVDDGKVVQISGGKRRALLALLLLNANRVVSADRLIDELWGESPPATAAKSIQVHVSQLRKALRSEAGHTNGHVVMTQGNGYALRVEQDDLDVEVFERALDDAGRSLAGGDARSAERQLREALELWRGPALADFAYEPFAQQEIARLEELRLAALEARMDAGLELGRHGQLIGELESLVREHPLSEHFCAQLMLALYRCGRQAEALAAYRHAERMFRDELGIEPTPELRELEARILAQDPELAAPARPVEPDTRPSSPAAPPPPGPPPEGGDRPERRRWPLRGPVLVTAAALLLGAAAGLAVIQQLDDGSDPGGPALDLATNSLVAVDVDDQEPEFAVPLPGRPTGLAAGGGDVWIPTVDSAALTGVDEERRGISRTVPMRGDPEAVAVGEGGIWVADGARGVLARIKPGYASASQTIRYPRAREAPASPGGRRVPRSSVAAGAGAVWVTNGTRELMRIEPSTGRVRAIELARPVNDVVVGIGAVWALSARAATVFRVDPRTNAESDRIPIVARSGGDAPFPIGIAAGGSAVWVLNGNTATVTRIDPSTRGVVTTIELGVERVPNDIAASRRAAWVANSDGTLARIDATGSAARSIWVGESLDEVAVDGSRVWATTTALDQRFPGGAQ
jgi:DNA-binding SARP family transcriptional activator